ncbi:MAG: hypothetical protein D4R88_05780 [Methanosarcinales archaeon]|nr:MAG: hypothetical protein D4R88_05780 [Methanosarcinales archaeon]
MSIWLKQTNKIEDEGKKAYSFVKDLTWYTITDDFENLLTNDIYRTFDKSAKSVIKGNIKGF